MDLRNFKLRNSIFPNDLEFKVVPNIEEYMINNNPTVFKVVISSISKLETIQKQLQSIDVSVFYVNKSKQYKDKVIDKEYEYLDITPSKTNKEEALAILSNYLNLSSSQVMAIGDNLNDIGMLKASGIGVAVANAYEEVKKVAKFTTVNTVDNSGFAEAVYKYISF
mgnify:CR=1 FL=1